MNTQSNVSSRQRPDVPATFESLNDDTLTTVLEFVGNKSYKSFGGINKRCREVYLSSGMTKKTFLYGYAPLSVIKDKCENVLSKSQGRGNRSHLTVFESVGKGVIFYNRRDVMDWALKQMKSKVLNGICRIAAQEEKIDLLNEVWNHNVKEHKMAYKRSIFECVDVSAARCGKLNVLKWLETKGLFFDTRWYAKVAAFHHGCAAQAAEGGQLHILKWLKEEKNLQLKSELCGWAASGGHLHVMKWLREQEVDWDEWTFHIAARRGNLDILQWLQYEGCPWFGDHPVHESELKPEALEWLQVNGYYGDRLVGR